MVCKSRICHKELVVTITPNILGFQLANTWTEKTAREVYAIVRNGKEPENLDFFLVAATVEKASTYVFAERLIRNAEVRGSIPLCSTSKLNSSITYKHNVDRPEFPIWPI